MALADDIQKLYIAYFGRPADPGGLEFYVGGDFGLDRVIAVFAASAESQALYGDMTPAAQVTSIYQNLFGRPPEPAGLAYWTEAIAAGTSPSQMAFTILQAAQGSDSTTIDNKLAAANAFTAAIDSPTEIANYTGTAALAAARAFLDKIDAAPGSIANLASDAAAAVGKATGTTLIVGGGGGDVPPSFSATKDGSGLVTVSNAGAAISVTLANGTYTFTSNGSSATLAGPIAGIDLARGQTLLIDLATAGTIAFPGEGTVKLTDTSASAVDLATLNATTTGLFDATSVLDMSGPASAVYSVLHTHRGNSGNAIKTDGAVAVTLTDTGSLTAATIAAIDTATTGLVDATAIATLEGSVADGIQVLVTSSSGQVAHKQDVAFTITGDSSATAADLIALEAATEGLVTTHAVTSVTGATLADATLLFITNEGSTGDKIDMHGLASVVLTDTTGDATALFDLQAAMVGWIDARTITSITDATGSEAQTLLWGYRGDSGDAIRFADNVAVTITSTVLTGSMVATILSGTTGQVTAHNVLSISSMTYAQAKIALIDRPGTLRPDVYVMITSDRLTAADLIALDAATSGLVRLGSGITITGTAAEIQDLYGRRGDTGNKINIPDNANLVITDDYLTSTVLSDLVGYTSGMIDATAANQVYVLAEHVQSLILSGDSQLTLSGGHDLMVSGSAATLDATDITRLDAATTGVVELVSTKITGSAVQISSFLETVAENTQIEIGGNTQIAMTDIITDPRFFDGKNLGGSITLNPYVGGVGTNQFILSNDTEFSETSSQFAILDSTVNSPLWVDASSVSDYLIYLGGGDGDDVMIGGSGSASTGLDWRQGDYFFGGGGQDTFIFNANNRSTLSALDTIEAYDLIDELDITDMTVVASNIDRIQSFSGTDAATLTDALSQMASLMNTDYGLGVFAWNSDMYAYVESDGAGNSYMQDDFVVKLINVGFSQTSIAGLGIDGV